VIRDEIMTQLDGFLGVTRCENHVKSVPIVTCDPYGMPFMMTRGSILYRCTVFKGLMRGDMV